jgi:hypothetical protein
MNSEVGQLISPLWVSLADMQKSVQPGKPTYQGIWYYEIGQRKMPKPLGKIIARLSSLKTCYYISSKGNRQKKLPNLSVGVPIFCPNPIDVVIESLDFMRNIFWLASCFSKIKKPYSHYLENQSGIAGVHVIKYKIERYREKNRHLLVDYKKVTQ